MTPLDADHHPIYEVARCKLGHWLVTVSEYQPTIQYDCVASNGKHGLDVQHHRHKRRGDVARNDCRDNTAAAITSLRWSDVLSWVRSAHAFHPLAAFGARPLLEAYDWGVTTSTGEISRV